MNGERTAGALQYPAYLLVWSIGVRFSPAVSIARMRLLCLHYLIAFEPLAIGAYTRYRR